MIQHKDAEESSRGDVQVAAAGALATTVVALSPGDRLALTIQYGDEERTVEVTLAERNGAPFLSVRPYWSPKQGHVTVRSLRTPPAPSRWASPATGTTALPHCRVDHTPASGDELQTEYFVPRRHAVAAMRAVTDSGAVTG